jgi:hypothetical protein
MPRFTRRELAALLSVSPLIAQSVPPAPPQPKSEAAPATPQKAADDVRQASEKLRALTVPMDVEPAFSFKAA